jgi:uncharacterized protein (DUF1501 family)
MITTSRRNLLKVGLGALPVISLAGTMPAFVPQFAFAEGAQRPDQSNDNILVVLQLTGGNDGLNTVIPFADDAYYRARPKIGIKKNLVTGLDDHFGLNPSLGVLKNVFDQGHLAIVNGCGYPKPNRSHFRSMEIWHTANPAKSEPTGWLGHYLDHAARGGLAPIFPLNIGTELPQALVAEGTPVPSIEKLEDFRLKSNLTSKEAARERKLVLDLNKASDDQSPALKFLARQATNAIIATDKVHNLANQNSNGVYYGYEGLGRQLQLITNLIAANSGTRLFYLQFAGFDTHANQQQMHDTLFAQLGQALSSFHQDLTQKGLIDKVTLMCFSEFGRRVAENSSQGTDHGAAAPMFVIGGKVKGGVQGKMPSLTDLDDGDLKYTTDFRRVYATLLDKWLNADSAKVLGAKFEPIGFL